MALGIELTPEASVKLREMGDQLHQIRYHYGEGSIEHARAAASLARSLIAVIGLGGKLSKAGDFDGLYGVNEYGFNYGLVFHRQPTPNWPEGMGFEDPNGTWSVNS